MVADNITVYHLKESKEDVYSDELRCILFKDGEPKIHGDSVPVVVEPLVTGEFSDRNGPLDVSAEEAQMDDWQEVNIDNYVPETKVKSLVSKIGFKHGTGCNEVIFDKQTVAENMVKETATGTALVIFGGLTGYKYVADAVSYISSASNLREEAVADWSDHITIQDGKPICKKCDGEVRIG